MRNVNRDRKINRGPDGSVLPDDTVCTVCGQIVVWAGTASRGMWRHSYPSGQLYITTHAPVPTVITVP